MKDLGPVTKLGMGRRTGEPIVEESKVAKLQTAADENGTSATQATDENGVSVANDGAPAPMAPPMLIRTRSKRKKLNWKPPRKPKKKKQAEADVELSA